MANPEHLAILKQGVQVWNEWRKKNPGAKIDLSRTNLEGVRLDGANLSKADFRFSNLRWVNFFESNLNRADLQGSELVVAYFAAADLGGADLRKAQLNAATFHETNLSGANFGNAVMGSTVFAQVDLSVAKGLGRILHTSASTLGIDTIYVSQGDIPDKFLRGCGVPEEMIDYAHALRSKALGFFSTFISHSSKDKRFCRKLYADLQAKGVRVWMFEEDAKWGQPVWGEIDRSIKQYDKLIVVLSENSLQSGPVSREIERALNREDKEGKNILFPIRIDDYIFEKWEHERQADVVRKVVGDFSGWDKDAAKYDKAFDKLLKGLQAGN